MSGSAQPLTLQAGGGRVQAVCDKPLGVSKGLAVVAHPHPLFGGTMDNKVVQTLAKACVAADWECLRFNFRGVGDSEGVFDAGRGETEDLLQLVDQWPADMPLVLAGFSFGAFVVCQALECALVVHGETDDTVALSAVMDWARPQQLPVMVLPGTGHFFHGQLPLLKSLALRHLRA